jgi:hypothetical protein
MNDLGESVRELGYTSRDQVFAITLCLNLMLPPNVPIVRVAQWILRLPTEQEIPSSNLGMDFGKVW